MTDGAPFPPSNALRAWGGVLEEEHVRWHRDAVHDRRSALDGHKATNRAEFFAVAPETDSARRTQPVPWPAAL